MIGFEDGRLIISETGLLRWIYDRTFGRDILEFTTTLRESTTGLPVNIFLDDSHDYIRKRHEKRIIFQGDYGHDANRSNLFFMTISKDNPQIPAKQLRKLKLHTKDIEAIKMFVKNNAELLDELVDEKIDWTPFFKRLKKYK